MTHQELLDLQKGLHQLRADLDHCQRVFTRLDVEARIKAYLRIIETELAASRARQAALEPF